jgi:hypothetical protein
MMTVGYKIDIPNLITEPIWAGSNLSRTSETGQRRAVSPPGAVAAIAAPHGWPELRSEPPQRVAVRVFQPKLMRGHRGYLP